jgi:hypothetical protein
MYKVMSQILKVSKTVAEGILSFEQVTCPLHVVRFNYGSIKAQEKLLKTVERP